MGSSTEPRWPVLTWAMARRVKLRYARRAWWVATTREVSETWTSLANWSKFKCQLPPGPNNSHEFQCVLLWQDHWLQTFCWTLLKSGLHRSEIAQPRNELQWHSWCRSPHFLPHKNSTSYFFGPKKWFWFYYILDISVIIVYNIIRRYRAIPSYGVRNSACRDVPASSTALKHSGSMPKITSDLPKELSTRQKEKHWYIITVKWWMLLEIHRNASSQILLKQKWNMHKPILPILFLPSPKRCLSFCFRPLASRNFWLHGRPQCFTEKTQPLGMAWKTSMGMVNQTIYDDFSSAEKMIFRKAGT